MSFSGNYKPIMFYSSDPKRPTHDNYLAPSGQDRYSSIRVLDQTNKNIRHSVSETNIMAKFSSEFANKGETSEGKLTKPRPYSTIGVNRGSFLTANDKKKSKSLKANRSSTSHDGKTTSDPFAYISHSVKQTLDLAVETSVYRNSKEPGGLHAEPTSSNTNWPAASGHFDSLPRETEPVVPDLNWPAVRGEISPLRSESRVSSPRYHALSEDELEEELREENEVRSRNDSVVLRHEIIRSYSITENLAQKTNKDEQKTTELDEIDGLKGYVSLRYDAEGVVWKDDAEEPSLSSDEQPDQDEHDDKKPSSLELTSNDSKLFPDHNSLAKQPANDIASSNFAREHKFLVSSSDNAASKRLTVDVGELNRQAQSKFKPSRPKHISMASGTIREIKFLRSPTSRVSTLFSTKIPEVRSPEKQKGSQKGKQPVEPGFVFFGDGLFDFTEERNEEAVAFSAVIGELRSKLCGKINLNLGYLLSPTVTQNSNSLVETFEDVPLCVEVFIQDQESPVIINCSSKTSVSDVVAKVLANVWKQEVNLNNIMNSAFTLKVCGYQEYLSNKKLLCEYEHVHQCIMARQNVRLALLDSDQVPRTLARSELDDVADCEPRIYSQFFDRPLDTSVSRDGLRVLREAFEDELKRVLTDADNQNPRFQPGRLIQSVRAVCTTLGQIETKGIVNSVYALKEMKNRFDEASLEFSGMTIDMKELRYLLQNLYRHVYLLIELYCNTFNTDFGRIRISEKVINGSIEVTAMTEQFTIHIPAAYRIPPEWKEKFETYFVEGKIFYGGKLLSVPERTVYGEIHTDFFPRISWQCFVTFGIELRKLPREAKLCLTLYGLPPVTKNGTLSPLPTPLGWTAVQLFDFNGLLVSGSQLFGLWPNQAANPLGTCTSNLIDKRSAILQVDFTQHMSDIVFAALKIPNPEIDTPEDAPMEMFSKYLSKDMFEDLRPEDVNFIWKNRYNATKVNKDETFN